jgi:hypothetical protein
MPLDPRGREAPQPERIQHSHDSQQRKQNPEKTIQLCNRASPKRLQHAEQQGYAEQNGQPPKQGF